MDSTFGIIYLFVHIFLGFILGSVCSEVAISKGYTGKSYFWFGFLFLFAGLLIVIAYKDLESEKQNLKIISSLNNITQLISDNQISADMKRPKEIYSNNQNKQLNASSKIPEKTNEKPDKTVLNQNVKENSIIQGKILKILSNTIIVAHNDDDNDILEVRNYPTDKIIDEVWVKIKVKYLFSYSNLTQVIEYIETIEQF